ncbi:hypothetical protein LMG31884_46560 (plasmid) [Xanthomonas hydrangeae]|nr:hypothetical protein LMG31884_46560 [Xanthomonas hydrangeae]CAD7740357.1 hypothetical protein LMG31884_46560 [Xanthomonas hydrangeae]
MDARARPQRSGGVPPWTGEVGGVSLTPRNIHRKPRSLPAKLICRTSGATTGLGGCKIRVKNGANSAHMPCKFRATASADSAWITQEHHRLVHKASTQALASTKGADSARAATACLAVLGSALAGEQRCRFRAAQGLVCGVHIPRGSLGGANSARPKGLQLAVRIPCAKRGELSVGKFPTQTRGCKFRAAYPR